jgi:hypothetical protein
MEFEMKDSGERKIYESGMTREPSTGKPRYDLIWRPGLKRVANVYGKGAQIKYEPRNWEKACTQPELDRFLESANRHFEQWFQGDTDEDHMSSCIFNMFGAEMVRGKLQEKIK